MKYPKETFTFYIITIAIISILSITNYIFDLKINNFINIQMISPNINANMITISSTIIGFALTVITIFGVSDTPIMKKLSDEYYEKTRKQFFGYTSLTIYTAVITIILSLFQKPLNSIIFNNIYLTFIIIDIAYFILFIFITLKMYETNQELLNKETSDQEYIKKFLFEILETQRKQEEELKKFNNKYN